MFVGSAGRVVACERKHVLGIVALMALEDRRDGLVQVSSGVLTERGHHRLANPVVDEGHLVVVSPLQ